MISQFLSRNGATLRPIRGWMFALVLGTAALMTASPSTQAAPNAKAEPQVFVAEVVDELIRNVQTQVKKGPLSMSQIHDIVNQDILPYVDLSKTTRLAAGKYWRQATPEQQKALTEAFGETLIRTYSGALTRVDSGTNMKILPFRGDVNAKDVVVQSSVTESSNTSPIRIDYRLEKSNDGWKIYDLNVENIWLIQNYRNQFAQQIDRGGIDGLIQSLKKRAATP